jgi:hypothetical protein
MIKNTRLTCSNLTGNVYIARYGKNVQKPLEKIEVGEECLVDALVCHFLHGAPKGVKMDFLLRGKHYDFTLKPIGE